MEQKILNAILSSTYKWRPYELAKDMELPLAEVKLHLENLRDAGKIFFEDGRYGRLILTGLNQRNEIALYLSLKPQLFLAQSGSKAMLAQHLPKGHVRTDR